MRLPAPPIIDLGGKLQVIDNTCDPPVWKTIARLYPASRAQARRVMAAMESPPACAWIRDDYGNRTLVNREGQP